MAADMKICPYNKSHIVRGSRFVSHLLNCQKNNPELFKEMLVCVFNESHHVRKEEAEDHFRNCPDGLLMRCKVKECVLYWRDKGIKTEAIAAKIFSSNNKEKCRNWLNYDTRLHDYNDWDDSGSLEDWFHLTPTKSNSGYLDQESSQLDNDDDASAYGGERKCNDFTLEMEIVADLMKNTSFVMRSDKDPVRKLYELGRGYSDLDLRSPSVISDSTHIDLTSTSGSHGCKDFFCDFAILQDDVAKKHCSANHLTASGVLNVEETTGKQTQPFHSAVDLLKKNRGMDSLIDSGLGTNDRSAYSCTPYVCDLTHEPAYHQMDRKLSRLRQVLKKSSLYHSESADCTSTVSSTITDLVPPSAEKYGTYSEVSAKVSEELCTEHCAMESVVDSSEYFKDCASTVSSVVKPPSEHLTDCISVASKNKSQQGNPLDSSSRLLRKTISARSEQSLADTELFEDCVSIASKVVRTKQRNPGSEVDSSPSSWHKQCVKSGTSSEQDLADCDTEPFEDCVSTVSMRSNAYSTNSKLHQMLKKPSVCHDVESCANRSENEPSGDCISSFSTSTSVVATSNASDLPLKTSRLSRILANISESNADEPLSECISVVSTSYKHDDGRDVSEPSTECSNNIDGNKTQDTSEPFTNGTTSSVAPDSNGSVVSVSNAADFPLKTSRRSRILAKMLQCNANQSENEPSGESISVVSTSNKHDDCRDVSEPSTECSNNTVAPSSVGSVVSACNSISSSMKSSGLRRIGRKIPESFANQSVVESLGECISVVSTSNKHDSINVDGNKMQDGTNNTVAPYSNGSVASVSNAADFPLKTSRLSRILAKMLESNADRSESSECISVVSTSNKHDSINIDGNKTQDTSEPFTNGATSSVAPYSDGSVVSVSNADFPLKTSRRSRILAKMLEECNANQSEDEPSGECISVVSTSNKHDSINIDGSNTQCVLEPSKDVTNSTVVPNSNRSVVSASNALGSSMKSSRISRFMRKLPESIASGNELTKPSSGCSLSSEKNLVSDDCFSRQSKPEECSKEFSIIDDGGVFGKMNVTPYKTIEPVPCVNPPRMGHGLKTLPHKINSDVVTSDTSRNKGSTTCAGSSKTQEQGFISEASRVNSNSRYKSIPTEIHPGYSASSIVAKDCGIRRKETTLTLGSSTSDRSSGMKAGDLAQDNHVPVKKAWRHETGVGNDTESDVMSSVSCSRFMDGRRQQNQKITSSRSLTREKLQRFNKLQDRTLNSDRDFSPELLESNPILAKYLTSLEQTTES